MPGPLPDVLAHRLAAALAGRTPGGAAELERGHAVPVGSATLQRGTVTAVSAGPPRTVTVRTDGQNDRVGVDTLYTAVPGDNVYVLEQPPLLVVVGPVADAEWVEVQPADFLNGWGNFGGGFRPARYRLAGGIVFLDGVMQGGTVNASAFDLPADCRPGATEALPTDVGGVFSRIDVGTGGAVVVGTTNSPPATPYAVLSGLWFPAG